ncbi:MAG: hypothetical protein AAB444_03185 [Patescibacteria group bacterium]
MKILVIDDTRTNLDAAKQTLVGHELTLAASYDEAYKLLEKPRGEVQPPFDVVLCDLLMPAGAVEQGTDGMKYVGQEMPVGLALALMAVLQGAKYVAVVTNLNHHQHPAAALLDRLGSDGLGDTEGFVKIRANGVPIGFVNYAPMIGVDGTTCTACGGTGKQTERDCWICKGSGKGYRDAPCNNCKGSGRETPKCDSCSGGNVRGKDWGRVLQVLLEN